MAHDTQTALQRFRQAYQYSSDLDPETQRRLQDHLQSLQAAQTAAIRPPAGPPSAVDEVAAKQQLLARQIASEISQAERTPPAQREADPKGVLAKLEELRGKVEAAQLDGASRNSLLQRIDHDLTDVRKYIAANGSRIEQDDHNRQVTQQLDRERLSLAELQTKFAEKIDKYNSLLHEQRFAEAEVVAKEAQALWPDNPLSLQIVTESKLRRAYAFAKDVQDRKNNGVLWALNSVDEAGVPFNDQNPYVLPDAKKWQDLSKPGPSTAERWAASSRNGRSRSARSSRRPSRSNSRTPR